MRAYPKYSARLGRSPLTVGGRDGQGQEAFLLLAGLERDGRPTRESSFRGASTFSKVINVCRPEDIGGLCPADRLRGASLV